MLWGKNLLLGAYCRHLKYFTVADTGHGKNDNFTVIFAVYRDHGKNLPFFSDAVATLNSHLHCIMAYYRVYSDAVVMLSPQIFFNHDFSCIYLLTVKLDSVLILIKR